ncbi:hypothetical protein H6F67_08820 [Microcoleus sp. FACHB-1515]|uniref:hypothetical protein n=1 Tax=Cyanophyceae TaxID=3028117 RepID=UPI001686347A|nr:hypothetical protein [Microcoleus sp. FACHB-1515]MBD2089955.1 hypothetical protein [Microcoleus sp. FACHB-1515]
MRQGKPHSHLSEMRVTASVPLRPLRSLVTVPAGRFAEQLQQRYQHQSIAAHAEMELRRSPPALSFSSHHHHPQLNFAPQLQLTVLHSPTLAAAQAAATVAESLTRSSHTVLQQQSQLRSRQFQRIEQTELLVQQLQRDRTEAVLQQELVQRMVDRTTRTETVTVSRAMAGMEMGSDTLTAIAQSRPASQVPLTMELVAAQPVPQVVRVAQSAESIAPEGRRSTPLSASPAASGLVPPVVPSIDVNRLTDQVMQTIDRRLLAYRERRGK